MAAVDTEGVSIETKRKIARHMLARFGATRADREHLVALLAAKYSLSATACLELAVALLIAEREG